MSKLLALGEGRPPEKEEEVGGRERGWSGRVSSPKTPAELTPQYSGVCRAEGAAWCLASVRTQRGTQDSLPQ